MPLSAAARKLLHAVPRKGIVFHETGPSCNALGGGGKYIIEQSPVTPSMNMPRVCNCDLKDSSWILEDEKNNTAMRKNGVFWWARAHRNGMSDSKINKDKIQFLIFQSRMPTPR